MGARGVHVFFDDTEPLSCPDGGGAVRLAMCICAATYKRMRSLPLDYRFS